MVPADVDPTDVDSTDADATDADALNRSDRRVWRRHPGDVARLVFRLLALLAAMGITALTPTALREVSGDLIRLLAQTPQTLRDALVGVAQLTAFLLPLTVLAALLARKRLAETALISAATVTAGLVMSQVIDWLDEAAPPQPIDDIPSDWLVAGDFPSVSYVAALVAGSAAASPLLAPSWRRVAWMAVGAAAGFQLFTATHAPVNLMVAVIFGSVVGSAALVLAGAPERRMGAASLRQALRTGGLEIDDLSDAGSELGRRVYRGRSEGQAVQIAHVDRDDRDADLLARTVRSVRVRSVDDDRLSAQPRAAVEHEALATMAAAEAGATVPRVLAVVPEQRETAIIALSVPDGRALEDLTADTVDDGQLDEVWRQLGALHRRRITHRSLTPDRIVLGDEGVTLLGFDNARLASTDEQVSGDIAQLLVTIALTCGAARTVAAARRVIDPSELTAALAFVQKAALPAETRRAVRADKGVVDELRSELQDQLEVEEVELASLDRISLVRMVTWVGFAVLAFFALTLISSWSEITDAMEGIDWSWVPAIVVFTLLATFGGALSLAGSVTRRVPLGEANLVMLGQSFLNRFTPSNSGGMAMRIRYLQKGGTDTVVATAAIGLTSAASGLLQVVFIAFFFVWSGSNPTDEVDTSGSSGPDGTIVLIFLAAIVVAAVVVALSPKLRRWVVDFVRSTISKIRADFGELARRPGKMGLLFGGAGLAKLVTLMAFVAACRAFGIELSFAELGALYLGASAVAAAVPTPGGVGAIEAALVFVLVNAGVDEATAWAATLLFRLINYWLITLPGYLALKACEHYELV